MTQFNLEIYFRGYNNSDLHDMVFKIKILLLILFNKDITLKIKKIASLIQKKKNDETEHAILNKNYKLIF